MRRRDFMGALAGATAGLVALPKLLRMKQPRARNAAQLFAAEPIDTSVLFWNEDPRLFFTGGPLDGQSRSSELAALSARHVIVRSDGLHEARYQLERIVGADWHLKFVDET